MFRISGEAYRNIRLCIDSYENGIMTGRSYFPALDKESRPFRCLSQFLVEMEQVLDEAGFPQSYTAKRTFRAVEDIQSHAANMEQISDGQCGTFDIRLAFRQHASWQGSVAWVEGRDEQPFRSVLELILLIDSAVGSRQEESA